MAAINEKPSTVTITQIVTSGQYHKEVLGLGDDGLVYEWVKASGKWKQNTQVEML